MNRDKYHRMMIKSGNLVQDRSAIHYRRRSLYSGQSYSNFYVRRKLASTSTSSLTSEGSHVRLQREKYRNRLGKFFQKRSQWETKAAALFLSRKPVTSTLNLAASANGLDLPDNNRGKDSTTLRQRLKSRLLKLLLLPWVSQPLKPRDDQRFTIRFHLLTCGRLLHDFFIVFSPSFRCRVFCL